MKLPVFSLLFLLAETLWLSLADLGAFWTWQLESEVCRLLCLLLETPWLRWWSFVAWFCTLLTVSKGRLGRCTPSSHSILKDWSSSFSLCTSSRVFQRMLLTLYWSALEALSLWFQLFQSVVWRRWLSSIYLDISLSCCESYCPVKLSSVRGLYVGRLYVRWLVFEGSIDTATMVKSAQQSLVISQPVTHFHS